MYKLGIIGFGIVGKSVLAFLNRQKIDYSTSASTEHDLFDDSLDVGRIQVQVWDSRILGPAEQEIVKVYKATAVDASVMSLKDFIQKNDFVFIVFIFYRSVFYPYFYISMIIPFQKKFNFL